MFTYCGRPGKDRPQGQGPVPVLARRPARLAAEVALTRKLAYLFNHAARATI